MSFVDYRAEWEAEKKKNVTIENVKSVKRKSQDVGVKDIALTLARARRTKGFSVSDLEGEISGNPELRKLFSTFGLQTKLDKLVEFDALVKAKQYGANLRKGEARYLYFLPEFSKQAKTREAKAIAVVKAYKPSK